MDTLNQHLVLSLFPGIDLFGRAFETEGFCVVRGPDPLWGGDVRRFHPPARAFSGVIGGPPCQDFSSLRRCERTGEGDELLAEFARVVTEARPMWWLLENVPRAPNVSIGGYGAQRIDVRGGEVGLRQRRLRHFQFGSVTRRSLIVPRTVTAHETSAAVTASEGRRHGRRGWTEFCALMGLDEPLALPGMTREARYRAVGNAVPLPMGRLLARSIALWLASPSEQACCACGCGRPVTGRRVTAGPACRKRLERQRRRQGVTDLVVTARSTSPPAESRSP